MSRARSTRATAGVSSAAMHTDLAAIMATCVEAWKVLATVVVTTCSLLAIEAAGRGWCLRAQAVVARVSSWVVQKGFGWAASSSRIAIAEPGLVLSDW